VQLEQGCRLAKAGPGENISNTFQDRPTVLTTFETHIQTHRRTDAQTDEQPENLMPLTTLSSVWYSKIDSKPMSHAMF